MAEGKTADRSDRDRCPGTIQKTTLIYDQSQQQASINVNIFHTNSEKDSLSRTPLCCIKGSEIFKADGPVKLAGKCSSDAESVYDSGEC